MREHLLHHVCPRQWLVAGVTRLRNDLVSDSQQNLVTHAAPCGHTQPVTHVPVPHTNTSNLGALNTTLILSGQAVYHRGDAIARAFGFRNRVTNSGHGGSQKYQVGRANWLKLSNENPKSYAIRFATPNRPIFQGWRDRNGLKLQAVSGSRHH